MSNGHKPLKHKDIKPLREKLWEKNENKCPICKRDIEEGDLALDHDHDTTLIRNTICKKCNSYEGVVKSKWKRSGLMSHIPFDELLRNLAEYLIQEQLPLIHPSHTEKKPKLMKSSYNKLEREVKKVNTYLSKKIRMPDFPKSGRMTKRLKELFEQMGIEPRYYTK